MQIGEAEGRERDTLVDYCNIYNLKNNQRGCDREG